MSLIECVDDFAKLFSGFSSAYNCGTYPIIREPNETGQKVESKVHYAKDVPVVKSLYARHLSGEEFVGIAPINEDNKATFGVLDIDVYGSELLEVVRSVYEYELPLLPFRTKSGGLHLYLFLKNPVSAKSLVDCLKDVDDSLGLSAHFSDKVEIFPKQVKLAPGQYPSPITLPYFNAECPSAYLIDVRGNEVKLADALTAIKRNRVILQDVTDAIGLLPFADAPKCIQTLRIMPWIRENGGRNKYLYSVCVYLKKKHGAAEQVIADELSDFNEAMPEPLGDEEVAVILKSVMEHEYNYKCSDAPCKTFCNSAKCRLRAFGVGKDKNAVFTGLEYGQMKRYMTADPYYEWQLKLADAEGDFKTIKFENEYELLDQRKFATLVMRYCNVAPAQINDNAWRQTLTLYMKNIQDVAVAESGDTSGTAVLRDEFNRYLATAKAILDPQIKIGLVVYRENKRYFTHRGFVAYIDKRRITLKDGIQIRELLLKFGAVEGSLDYVNTQKVATSVPCWVKDVDKAIEETQASYDDILEAQDALINDADEDGKAEKEAEEVNVEDVGF